MAQLVINDERGFVEGELSVSVQWIGSSLSSPEGSASILLVVWLSGFAVLLFRDVVGRPAISALDFL